MDRCTWAQDVLRCHLCETTGPPMYCDICHIYLCKACVGEHITDESKEHSVVSLKNRGSTTSYPKCSIHKTKQCELHCIQCDIPICVQCVSSNKHLGHTQVDILEYLNTLKEALQRDLKELEKSIYPRYQEIKSHNLVQKDDMKKNSKKLADSIEKHGEDLHREIDNAIKKLKSDVDEIESTNLVVLDKQEKGINRSISEIEQNIADLRKLLNSNDVSYVSTYKSRNADFRRLPPKLTVSLPNFTPQKINKAQIHQQIGSLSALSMKTGEYGNTMTVYSAESYPPTKQLSYEPRIITNINTEYGDPHKLCSVQCLRDQHIWMSGEENIMRLYNLQGEHLKSIQTKSGNIPVDIAVTRIGELVYTDPNDRTVNIVKNAKIQTVIKLQGWRPLNVCSTSSGDLLVIMITDDEKQAKVVRYSGSKEKQTIQFYENGQPLYSSSYYTKYLCENSNLNVCVADTFANAVVVVNQAGKFQFSYTGPSSTCKESFRPVGIATDSKCSILTADFYSNVIHIISQDGQFLCYINIKDLLHPWGLCVDTRDNLFVAEWETGKMKEIQYNT
nr:uncharacterized protein LOC117690903 [Crassostrea gigas]